MRSVAENRELFRSLLERDSLTVMPGGFSPLEAAMAARAGYEAFFLPGSQTSAYLYAVPDTGILGLHDMAGQAGHVAARAGIPVLVDGDTGYGNAVNVYFAVQAMVRSGAAAVQIEDQEAPKKSGTSGGRRLVTVDEAVGKYRAAVRARDEIDAAFSICARCDAIGAERGGFEEAVRRCVRYVEDGGADFVWLNSVQTREQIAEACERIPAPVMTVWGGGSPEPGAAEYERLGLRIALYPVLASKAGMQAAWDMLHDFRDRGTAALADYAGAVADRPWGKVPLTSLTGTDAVRDLEAEFLPPEIQRDYQSTFGHLPHA